MSSLTDYLAEVEARAEKATPGPWTWINAKADDNRGGRLYAQGALISEGDDGFIYLTNMDDAAVLAAAPTDSLRLVALCREQAKLGDRMAVLIAAVHGPRTKTVDEWRELQKREVTDG